MQAVLTSPPLIFATGIRFLLASPLLSGVAWFSSTPLLFPHGRRLFQVVLMLFYFALPFSLMIYTEESISPGIAALLFSVMLAGIALISVLLLGQCFSMARLAGILVITLALGGIIWKEPGTPDIRGGQRLVAIFLAVCSHAVVYVCCRRYWSDVPVLICNAVPCLGAGLLLSCVGFFLESPVLSEVTGLSVMAVSCNAYTLYGWDVSGFVTPDCSGSCFPSSDTKR